MSVKQKCEVMSCFFLGSDYLSYATGKIWKYLALSSSRLYILVVHLERYYLKIAIPIYDFLYQKILFFLKVHVPSVVV